MGFLSGRVTALRFHVTGMRPVLFEQEQLDRLADHAAGRQKVAAADGVEVGWTAGGSVLDTDFNLEKCVVNDALHFELRVDTNRLPGELLKAYYQTELQALSKDNPSGIPSARQKREAKQIARDRLEAEAKDGRYLKRKCVPVMWDRLSNEVLFGATSFTHIDRLTRLFEQTFGCELKCVTADARASFAMGHAHLIARHDAPTLPSKFVADAGDDVAWIAGGDSRDFLGNEFLLWLWYFTDAESDTVKLGDGSELTLMLARQLVVDCPRGQTGTDGFKSEGPSRLPEARRAVQAGKLPRRAGLTLVRHGAQFELVLHAETLGIGAARLPADEESQGARARLEQRVTDTRAALEAIDLLYSHFVHLRLSDEWADTLGRMQQWLANGARANPAEDVLRLTGQAVADALKGLGAVSIELKPGAAA